MQPKSFRIKLIKQTKQKLNIFYSTDPKRNRARSTKSKLKKKHEKQISKRMQKNNVSPVRESVFGDYHILSNLFTYSRVPVHTLMCFHIHIRPSKGTSSKIKHMQPKSFRIKLLNPTKQKLNIFYSTYPKRN